MIKYRHSILSSPESLNVNNLSLGALIPFLSIFVPFWFYLYTLDPMSAGEKPTVVKIQ